MADQTYHQDGSYASLQDSQQQIEDQQQEEDMRQEVDSKGSLNDLLVQSQDHVKSQGGLEENNDNEVASENAEIEHEQVEELREL